MSIPQFTLPSLISSIGRRLPALPPTFALAQGLNMATRIGLLPRDLDWLEQRCFCIAVSDLGLACQLLFENGRYRRVPAATEPDVTIRASLSDYLQLLAREQDPDTLFFQRRLVIEGDTELGLAIKNLLDSIDPGQWRQQLPVIGRLFNA